MEAPSVIDAEIVRRLLDLRGHCSRVDELARIDDAAELLGVTLPTEDEDG